MVRLERRKAAAAVASGALTALAMPGFGFSLLVFVSLIPLLYALDGKHRFLYGILFGATFLALDLRWILALYRFSPLVLPGFTLLVLYFSLFFGAAALLFLRRRTGPMGGDLLFIAPAVLTLLEIVRALGPLGTVFSSLFHTLYRFPWLIRISSVLGPWSVTAVIVFVNVALFLAARQRRVRYALAAAGALVVSAGFALLPSGLDGEPIRVAVVSSNVAQEEKLDGRNLAALTDRYESLGQRAVVTDPDLVVFPESILPSFILSDEEVLVRFSDLARNGQTQILFGTGVYRAGKIYNMVALLSEAGALVGTYAMVRPVPFGEYIPGRRLWNAIGLKGLVDSFLPVDLTPGDGFNPLDRIGTPICFESTFPWPARALVRDGAELLVVVTNDAWFAGNSELSAHFAAAVFRAVETGRYVVQAANGGVSGLIDPQGRILAATRSETVTAGTLHVRNGQTLYARWGDVPLLLLFGVGGLMLLAVRVHRRSNKQNGE